MPDIAVTCSAWDPAEQVLPEPLAVIGILSPSNKADTSANVWSYVTIPSVREILVLHTTKLCADLLRRQTDGTWPDNPLALQRGDALTLASIDFSAPLEAFYRAA